jgi:FdrA protein
LALLRNLVKRNFYRDSFQLLKLSEEAKKIECVKDAAVVMGTSTNKTVLANLGLLTEEGKAATDSDMILSVMADTEFDINEGLRKVEALILKSPAAKGRSYFSLDGALQAMPDANLAIVSIPGEYARDVVLKLLDKGISVHLFSDHVPTEQEVELKQYAKSKGLLMMGPGAGTSIIAGKGIAFANVVKRGTVGIVAAAGTGLQEVSVLLSETGFGVSEGLGTGGGDVKTQVGGSTILQSIDALEKDTETRIIVVVSKLPDPDVTHLLLEHIAHQTRKRYVTCFLGPQSYDIPLDERSRVKRTRTLHAAFSEAMRALDPDGHRETMRRFTLSEGALRVLAKELSKGMKDRQRYIRGLYTGGTLAYETLLILGRLIGDVYSNAPLDPRFKLSNPYQSVKDTIIDLGEEEFTSSRAHPMIDPTIRKLRLVEEAKNPEVGVILMDFMLGFGSHPDPAGAMLAAVEQAKNIAESEGRILSILGHVCGTKQDPQSLSEQEAKLRKAGVQIFKTNAIMAIAGVMVSKRGTLDSEAVRDVYEHFLEGF